MVHALQTALPGAEEEMASNSASVAVAEELVNPASGIANDYLNLFNEVVMLIEQLPNMPELIDDLKAWRPTTYEDYFLNSPLPGRSSALEAYKQLDAGFRKEFEQVVAELDQQSTGVAATIRLHMRARAETDPDGLESICARGGAAIRDTLERATAIVNEGLKGIERYKRAKRARLDRIRRQATRDVEDFYNNPIWRPDEDL
jgi:hypothetical protein